MDFSSLPHCIYLSPPTNYDKNFQITQLGYHNFQTIKPVFSYWRKQDFFTFHFILNGEGVLKINGKTYKLKKNHCFFIPPDVEFLYYPLPSNPWSYMWFGVSGEFFKKLFENYGYSIEKPTKQVALNLFLDNLILDFFTNKASLTTNEETMLSFFFSLITTIHDQKQFSVIKNDELFVERAKTLIELNFNLSDFSIEQISESLHISHSRLCDVFKQKTGTTLKKYLVEIRLKWAMRLLTETEESVSHIAELCGYNCALYFSNAFKKFAKVSPLEYRTLHKQKTKK